MTKRTAPNNLHPTARDLLETLEQEYVFEHHERVLLHQALTALSLSLQAAEVIAAEGLTIKTVRGGGCKTHPAVAVQRNASLTFASLLRTLDLAPDGRKSAPIPGARIRTGGRVQ